MLKRSNLNFITGLAILLLAMIPLNYYILEELIGQTFLPLHYYSYLYFVTLVLVVHFILVRSLKKRPQRFVINFMAVMGIKIFLSLILLVVFIYFFDVNKKVFGINYMILYLVFSSYSIASILKAQKKADQTN